MRQTAIRPLAAEAAATALIVDAGAEDLARVRDVAMSPNLPADPALRLLTIVRGLRRSAVVDAEPLSATAFSPVGRSICSPSPSLRCSAFRRTPCPSRVSSGGDCFAPIAIQLPTATTWWN